MYWVVENGHSVFLIGKLNRPLGCSGRVLTFPGGRNRNYYKYRYKREYGTIRYPFPLATEETTLSGQDADRIAEGDDYVLVS